MDRVQIILARASICSPAGEAGSPNFDAIAARAPEWGWTELTRREALRLQAVPDNKAVVSGWKVGPPEAPSYLLIQAPATFNPRALTCELMFEEPDSASVQSLLSTQNSGEPLGAPTLEGPLPQGGRFVEWTAPEAGGWKRITYLVPLPPRKGPTLSRIRYSGVER